MLLCKLVNGTDHFQINGTNCPIALNCSFLRLWPGNLHSIFHWVAFLLCINLKVKQKQEYLHLDYLPASFILISGLGRINVNSNVKFYNGFSFIYKTTTYLNAIWPAKWSTQWYAWYTNGYESIVWVYLSTYWNRSNEKSKMVNRNIRKW